MLEKLLENPKIELIVDDAMKVLPTLKSESFDLAVLDPPYLVTDIPKVREEHMNAMDGRSINWVRLMREIYRILKADGMMVIFGHMPTFGKLWRIIESSGFTFVIDLIWVKPIPVNYLKAKEKPLSRHETILVWKKGRMRYNWEEALDEGKSYVARKKEEECPFYSVKQFSSINTGYRYMTTVIHAPNKPFMPMDERCDHPNQKPLSLVEKLVRAFSFKGDDVIDPFAGSGTTLLACARSGRNCLGIEINEKYAEIIRTRMKKSTQLTIDVFTGVVNE